MAGERTASGLRGDFSEGAGIDIEVGIARSWMVQDIAGVDTKRQVSVFPKPDPLLKICIKVPASRTVNRSQTQRAQLSRRCVPQDDVRSCGVGRDGAVAAETSQIRCAAGDDAKTRRVRHSV